MLNAGMENLMIGKLENRGCIYVFYSLCKALFPELCAGGCSFFENAEGVQASSLQPPSQ